MSKLSFAMQVKRLECLINLVTPVESSRKRESGVKKSNWDLRRMDRQTDISRAIDSQPVPATRYSHVLFRKPLIRASSARAPVSCCHLVTKLDLRRKKEVSGSDNFILSYQSWQLHQRVALDLHEFLEFNNNLPQNIVAW